MKKKILPLLLALPFLTAASISFAKTNALEDAIAKASKKIAGSQEIPSDAKFAFIDFCETATGKHMNLSFAIEDELSIALIREMPGRIMLKYGNSAVNSVSEEKQDIFQDLAHLQDFSKKAKADYIIGGNYHFDSENATININVINTSDGIILFSERIKIRRSELSKKLLPENAK